MFNFKNIIKRIMLIRIYKKCYVSLDRLSRVSLFNQEKFKGSEKYKVVVRNSKLTGDITAGEGCKFLNANCSGKIKIGRFVSINGPGTRISSRIHGIEIGSFTSIASNVIIQEDFHRIDKVSTYFMSQNIFKDGIEKDIYSKGQIVIEEDVWIGSNSVILSGVKIGRGSVVGAGSVVTNDIPKYSIIGGNPAIVIKSRFSEHIIQKLEASKWWEKDLDLILKNKAAFNMDIDELIVKQPSLFN